MENGEHTMNDQPDSQLSMVNSPLIPPGYKLTEMGVIPEDWDVIALAEAAKIVDSLHQTPSFVNDGYPMVRVTDIKTGNISFTETIMVSEATFVEFTKNYKPKRGDIVLSRVGSYGISSFVETDQPFCLGQNTVVLVPGMSSRFLYYILNSRGVRQQIEDGSYGSGYKSLSLKNIKELKILIPHMDAEQRAIAAALSDMDELIAKLDQIIAKKRDIKQAAMQELLTGKTRLPGFGINSKYKKSEIGFIPEDWSIYPLGMIVDFLDGKRKPVKDSDRAKMRGNFPYYGASGIVDYVDTYLFDEDLILLGEDGENIISRNCRLAIKVTGKIWVNNHAHVLKPHDEIDIFYLQRF